VAAGRPLLARQPFDAAALDEVILGCVAPGPDEANIARVVALRLGCGERVPAWTVQRNCGSGLQAIDTAAQSIASGRSNLVLAGGTEAMSHHPVLLSTQMVIWLAGWSRARGLLERTRQLARLRPAHLQPVIGLLHGLTDPIVGFNMGQTAEQLAWRFDVSRTAMDAFALESHQRAVKAQAEGWLSEIEPIFDDDGRCFEQDDGVRADTDLDQLSGACGRSSTSPRARSQPATAPRVPTGRPGSCWPRPRPSRVGSCRYERGSTMPSGPASIRARWASARCMPWPRC
jgi:acetyl-CoA C-acetyltransferase